MSNLILLFLFKFSYALDLENQKGAFPVIQVTDEFVIVKTKLVKGQNTLIVRKELDGDDYETVATGKVIASSATASRIGYDRQRMKKRPDNKDMVVALGPPKVFVPTPEKVKAKESLWNTETVEVPEAGFIALKYVDITSSLVTESPNRANRYKQITKLRKSGFDLEWFVEFLPHFGFELSYLVAGVPISSYYRQDVSAQVSETTLQLKYRTLAYGRWRGFFSMITDDNTFVHENPDEAILSTKWNAVYLAASAQYEFSNPLFESKSTSVKLTSARLNFAQSLSLKATDLKATRGESANGTQNKIQIELNSTVYLPWMPLIKRYFFELTYFQTARSLQFSGKTQNDQNGLFIIPADQVYKETENGWSVNIGFRIEDYIGRIFQPKH